MFFSAEIQQSSPKTTDKIPKKLNKIPIALNVNPVSKNTSNKVIEIPNTKTITKTTNGFF